MQKTRYLLQFANEHLPFRWAEFRGVAEASNCTFKIIHSQSHKIVKNADKSRRAVKTEHGQSENIHLRHLQNQDEDQIPFCVIETDEPTDKLSECIRRSVLIKSMYELWAQSSSDGFITRDSLRQDLYKKITQSSEFQLLTSKQSVDEKSTFKVCVMSYGCKLSQSDQVRVIESMDFLHKFPGRLKLKCPNETFNLIEYYGNKPSECNSERPLQLFFGRWLTDGARNLGEVYSLKSRKFIANTSMDPILSLIMANCARIKHNSFVYDPFVGSGSLLVACAHMGAFVCGSDIDFLLLHGRSRPTRHNQKQRECDESIRSNLDQYNLAHRYIDALVADSSQSREFWHSKCKFDAIVTDPPYGFRESTERVGLNRQRKAEKKIYDSHYPSKVSYNLDDILRDLLTFSACRLELDGFLVYWLPKASDWGPIDSFIPQHPCLELRSTSEQILNSQMSRLLIVMQKTQEPHELFQNLCATCDSRDGVGNEDGLKNLCIIPETLRDNIRDKYFKLMPHIKSNKA